jgi:Family of unknown function (DUF5808)
VSSQYGEVVHEVTSSPWRLGVFYVDPSDRRLIVRQRTGLGWTLNFGHPMAWVIAIALLGFALWRRSSRSGRRAD